VRKSLLRLDGNQLGISCLSFKLEKYDDRYAEYLEAMQVPSLIIQLILSSGFNEVISVEVPSNLASVWDWKETKCEGKRKQNEISKLTRRRPFQLPDFANTGSGWARNSSTSTATRSSASSTRRAIWSRPILSNGINIKSFQAFN